MAPLPQPETIADAVGASDRGVSEEIAEIFQSANFGDLEIFRDFERDDAETSGRRVYDVWTFPKAEKRGAPLRQHPAADVRQGTVRDAVLFSVSANAAHGQRRTNDDKRRAVLRLLNDPEWSHWSDGEIGRRCGVSDRMVAGLRPRPIPESFGDESPQTRTVERNGAVYQQRVRTPSAPARESQAPVANNAPPTEKPPPQRFDDEAAALREKA